MQQTFGEIRLAFSVKGNMEDADNTVNEFMLDIKGLQKMFDAMGIDLVVKNVEVDFDDE